MREKPEQSDSRPGGRRRAWSALVILLRVLIVNDKKWRWYYSVGTLVAMVYYGWLFSPIPMYYVVGVPNVDKLQQVRGQFEIVGNHNITRGSGVPKYYVITPSSRVRVHCGPLPHPVKCAFFDLYLNQQAVSKFWFDSYFGVLQVQLGGAPELNYAPMVRIYIKNELGRDGKLAVLVFPLLLIVYGWQVRRAYLVVKEQR